MNIFLFELWNDSTKTIRLLALDFYAVIADLGFALIEVIWAACHQNAHTPILAYQPDQVCFES